MSVSLSIIQTTQKAAENPDIVLGRKGEELAAVYLRSLGFRMVVSNFKVPVGRNRKGVQVTGEIDLIAIEDETLCFVEVKSRRSDEFAPIITAVDLRKQRQITRTAKIYRKIFGLRNVQCRFDVVTVLIPIHTEPEVKLTRSYWSENKFKKNSWSQNFWTDFA